jgi:hypothetical protein
MKYENSQDSPSSQRSVGEDDHVRRVVFELVQPLVQQANEDRKKLEKLSSEVKHDITSRLTRLEQSEKTGFMGRPRADSNASHASGQSAKHED